MLLITHQLHTFSVHLEIVEKSFFFFAFFFQLLENNLDF